MGKKISESVLDVCEDSKTLMNQLDRASIFAKYSEHGVILSGYVQETKTWRYIVLMQSVAMKYKNQD